MPPGGLTGLLLFRTTVVAERKNKQRGYIPSKDACFKTPRQNKVGPVDHSLTNGHWMGELLDTPYIVEEKSCG